MPSIAEAILKRRRDLALWWYHPRYGTEAVMWCRTDVVGGLAALMIAGILGEPTTWSTLRKPTADRLNTACVALEIALPAALAWKTIENSSSESV